MSRRFARAGGPTGSEVITGANLVAHATPHTLGSWVEIDASVAQDCCGLWIGSNTIIGVATTATAMIVELGFGAAASEVTRVQFIAGGHELNVAQFLPLHIPAGTRLSGRIQAAVTVDIYTPQVTLEFCRGRFAWGGYSVAEAIGLNAATSEPTTGDLTDNAFDEAVASTASPYRALTFHPGITGTAASTVSIPIDVAIGAAASEQVLGQWFCRTTTAELVYALSGPRFLEKPIPVGSRLSIRKNSTGDLTGHLIGWR